MMPANHERCTCCVNEEKNPVEFRIEFSYRRVPSFNEGRSTASLFSPVNPTVASLEVMIVLLRREQ